MKYRIHYKVTFNSTIWWYVQRGTKRWFWWEWKTVGGCKFSPQEALECIKTLKEADEYNYGQS